jgi:putative ABC transport system permease protein
MFDRFAMVASLIAVLISALVTLKIMAGNINERAREIGILKAVGWTGRNVMSQLLGESLVQGLLGGLAGVFVAWLVIFGLSFTQISIPIPWDMSPVPHFLPGGDKQIFKTFALQIAIPWHLAVFTVTLSLLIGVVATGLLSRIVSRIKPAEVLRHE